MRQDRSKRRPPFRAGSSSFRLEIERLEARTLLSAGVLDPNFGSAGKVVTDFGASDGAVAVVVQSDGKVVTIGSSGGVLRPTSFALARYLPNGTSDGSFGTDGKVINGGRAEAATLQPDDKIIVAGDAQVQVGQSLQQVFFVARYLPNGTPDPAFGTRGGVLTSFDSETTVHGVVLQSDGKIVVVGLDRNSMIDLARYDTHGDLDPAFGTGGKVSTTGGFAAGIALQSDGKIVVAANANSQAVFLRFNTDGSRDTSFSGVTNVSGNLSDVTVQSDNKVVGAVGTASGFVLVRLTAAGNLDTTFGNGGQASVTVGISVRVQSDGRIVTSGWAPGGGHGADLAIARYQADGSPDSAFGTNGVTIVNFGIRTLARGLALQPDSSIVAAGQMFLPNDGLDDFAMARVMGDATPPPSGTANQRFVDRIYGNLLLRPADPNGLNFWSGLLDQGKLSRTGLVLAIERSHEYHMVEVEELYQTLFRRSADPSSSTWVNFLDSGRTREELRATLLASDEYLALGFGGFNSSFVKNLYSDVLQRGPDADGENTWNQALFQGTPRSVVAAAFVNSREAAQVEVGQMYRRFLARQPDTDGFNTFVDLLQRGVANEVVVATLLGSGEFFGP